MTDQDATGTTPNNDDEQQPDSKGEALIGAATEVAVGAAAAGWAGAGKAALKVTLESPKGRRLLIGGIVASAVGPFVLLLASIMIMNSLVSVGLAASNQAANSSMVGMVAQVGFSDDDMTAITTAAQTVGIQWEVLAAVYNAEQWASDGDGPYHITTSPAGVDLQDMAQASAYVAAKLRAAMDQQGINPTLDIGSGATVYSDKTVEWADPDGHKNLIEAPYAEALATLPVDGADDDWGLLVIQQAVNWRLGIIDSDLSYCAPAGDSLTVNAVNKDGSAGESVTLNSKQLGYAAIIYNEGQRAGVNDNAIQAALMTVMVETRYQNLASEKIPESSKYPNDGVARGDHTSIGLFQQQNWWGSVKNRMDPEYAAKAFYGKAGLKGVPGVLQISGWQTMDPGELAQAVQRSAGGWYWLWKQAGAQILAKVQGITCDSADYSGTWSGVIAFANDAVAKKRWQYSWGGGGLNGPSNGIGRDAGKYGFDCSGFVQWVVYQGSGKRVALPGDSRSQARWLQGKDAVHRTANWKELKPGDIVFFSHGSSLGSIYHVALVVAPGVIDEAPGEGRLLQQNHITDRMPYDIWGYARFDLLTLSNRKG